MKKIIIDNQLEQKSIYVTKNHSYYKHLKFVIYQSDIVAKDILSKNTKSEYNGVTRFLPFISGKSVFLNISTINLDNSNDFEIRTQKTKNKYDFNNPRENEKVVDLKYEHVHLSSIFEKQFINWWETNIKNKISYKYNGLNNANSICQFARQVRNSFGHSKINVTTNNCAEPIWNGLNLKNNNGEDIFKVLSIADLINLWIEFEKEELQN